MVQDKVEVATGVGQWGFGGRVGELGKSQMLLIPSNGELIDVASLKFTVGGQGFEPPRDPSASAAEVQDSVELSKFSTNLTRLTYSVPGLTDGRTRRTSSGLLR